MTSPQRFRRSFLVSGTLLAAAIGASAAPPVDTDIARVKADLIATDAAFSKLSVEKGALAAFLTYAADDVTMMPANQPALKGKEGVRTALGGLPAGFVLVWKPLSADVAASGDLGYTLGTYEARTPAEGTNPASVRYGKYCSVWKKQTDGTWKFVVDIGTPSPTPAP